MFDTKQKKMWLKSIFDNIELKLAIKAGIAASLSLFLGLAFSKVFQRPDTLISGLWCVLSSIVVLQAQLGGTYKAAWVRFCGVAIGSIIGSLFFVYVGTQHFSSLGISIFFTVIICSLLNLKDSFRIASLSTAVIIVFGEVHHLSDPWAFSLFRFLDSCIGIAVAVFVAHVLWPEKASENLRLNLVKILGLLGKQYRIATDLHVENSKDIHIENEIFDEIQELAYENLTYVEEAKLEFFNGALRVDEWVFMSAQLETIFESVMALRSVPFDMLTKIFDDSLSEHVSHVITKTDAGLHDLEKMVEHWKTPANLGDLQEALVQLNQDLLRFRSTRTTGKFNLEDVESFFVFFYRLRVIGESVIKMGEYMQKLSQPLPVQQSMKSSTHFES